MGRARAGLADPASPLAQAPDGRGARGRAAPCGPTASAPPAGRTTAAATAAAAPGPALPAQLVALRAAEPAALGRGQQGGFRVRARLSGVSDACPTGRALFSGLRRRVEPRARGLGAHGRPPRGSVAVERVRRRWPRGYRQELLGHCRLPGQRCAVALRA